MITIKTQIEISAPIEFCFDAARNIDIHTRTVWKHTKEKAIVNDDTKLLELNEVITFEATHFLIRQRLTSKIIEYNRPYLFIDEMQKGIFKSLTHKHEFTFVNGKTIMTDTLNFEAPLGVLGWLVERLILKNYMKKFVDDRNNKLKNLIEKQLK